MTTLSLIVFGGTEKLRPAKDTSVSSAKSII